MNTIHFDLDYSKNFKASWPFWFLLVALPAGKRWCAGGTWDVLAAPSNHPAVWQSTERACTRHSSSCADWGRELIKAALSMDILSVHFCCLWGWWWMGTWIHWFYCKSLTWQSWLLPHWSCSAQTTLQWCHCISLCTVKSGKDCDHCNYCSG